MTIITAIARRTHQTVNSRSFDEVLIRTVNRPYRTLQSWHVVRAGAGRLGRSSPRYPADRVEGQEDRWYAIDTLGAVVVLVVVHGHPEPDIKDRIRIISARKGTLHGRKHYEQEGA